MSLPGDLHTLLCDEHGYDIMSSQKVSGGSINRAARVEIRSAGTCFLKWNTSEGEDLFVKEVKGLGLLEESDSDLRVPEVIACGATPTGTGFLLMEYIEQSPGHRSSPTVLGEELARLHFNTSDRFGLDHDNYIGRLPQSNSRHEKWTSFFIEERMQPQLEMARQSGKLNTATESHFEKMYGRLDEIFPPAKPSLLHGDLWGGNYFFDSSGRPTVYDPAVYYGHPEMELSFTHLFGGFSGSFYDSYRATHSLEPGFEKRKDIYNLYPLLVHTNLFGGSYGRQVENIVKRFR